MKNDKKILAAFLLNLFFSLFELVGGAATGSVAIASDALHDMGDAAGIGLSYYFERKSKKGLFRWVFSFNFKSAEIKEYYYDFV